MKKALIALAVVAFVVAGAAQPAFAQQEENNETEEPEQPENETDEEIEVEQGDNEAEIEREGEIYLELRGNISQSNEATLIATSEGEPVANATVEVNGEEVGTTDSNGELMITIPDLREFEIEVETEELEGSIEVEIETEESETEEAEREDEETEESENESQGESAQFDARLSTAIRTVDALIEIAPNDEAEQGLQNALNELRAVQNNTDTASLGSEDRAEEAENESENGSEELGQELGQEGEEGSSSGPPGTRGPSENSNRPGFVNQMLGGIFG